tara:strand:+ start:400 stop:615 length:216 start_codon:yes stop_codon:yes gene_type:complete
MTRRISVDLNQNVFGLIALSKQYGRQLGYSGDRIAEIRKDMTSGTHEHAKKVFRKNFGHVVNCIDDAGDWE